MRQPLTKPESLEARIAKRSARKRGHVFLRTDFDDRDGYDQAGRVLCGLVRIWQDENGSRADSASITQTPDGPTQQKP